MANKYAVIYNFDSGMFEIGIPTRPLLQEEWDAVPAVIQARLLAQKVYLKPGDKGAASMLKEWEKLSQPETPPAPSELPASGPEKSVKENE